MAGRKRREGRSTRGRVDDNREPDPAPPARPQTDASGVVDRDDVRAALAAAATRVGAFWATSSTAAVFVALTAAMVSGRDVLLDRTQAGEPVWEVLGISIHVSLLFGFAPIALLALHLRWALEAQRLETLIGRSARELEADWTVVPGQEWIMVEVVRSGTTAQRFRWAALAGGAPASVLFYMALVCRQLAVSPGLCAWMTFSAIIAAIGYVGVLVYAVRPTSPIWSLITAGALVAVIEIVVLGRVKIDLRGSDLHAINFMQRHVGIFSEDDARLSGESSIDLGDALLQDADLSMAFVVGLDFEDASVEGTDFTLAVMTDTQRDLLRARGARVQGALLWDGASVVTDGETRGACHLSAHRRADRAPAWIPETLRLRAQEVEPGACADSLGTADSDLRPPVGGASSDE